MKTEYKCIQGFSGWKPHLIEIELNKLAEEGWELVAIDNIHSFLFWFTIWIFKRQKPAKDKER